MSDSDVESLVQLNFGFGTKDDWDDLEQVYVGHHGNAPIVASQKETVRWLEADRVLVAKVSFTYQLDFLCVLVEC